MPPTNPNPPPKPPEPSAPGAPDNFKTLLDAGASQSHPRSLFLEAGSNPAPLAIVPNGYRAEIISLERVEEWHGAPIRKRGTFAFDDVPSFIRFFNEQKTADARIFAKLSDSRAKFYGILNFQGADTPSFNDHRCAVELRPTHEFEQYTLNAKKVMTQAVFAQFLEDNADWFLEPSGADLLELITSLEGHAHVDITQAVKLQTGAIKLAYTESVELKGVSTSQTGEMEVPKELRVSIAPFEGTRHHSLRARLRYRIDNRKITFWYEPVDAHLVLRALFNELLDNIESQTNLVPFRIAAEGLHGDEGNDD